MEKLSESLLPIVCRRILLKGNFLLFKHHRKVWYKVYFCVYRPTATELLKHPIFKKAKDKKYLQSTLIAIGPSLETRVQKVDLVCVIC